MNPVLWLELRTRLRERKLWILAILFLLLFGGIDFAVIFGNAWKNPLFVPPAEVGNLLQGTSVSTLMGFALVLGWAIGAGRLTQEREQRTLSGLLNTPLATRRIVIGKLLGSWALLLWFFSLTLPFFAFAAVWGGVSWAASLGALVVCVFTGLTITALAVGLSGYFRRTATSYIAVGLFLLVWLALLPILDGILHLPLEGKTHPYWNTALDIVLLNHNPVYILVGIMDDSGPLSVAPGFLLLEGFVVWTLLSVLSLRVGARGLLRGLEEKL